mgnify:CR=1 FL=1
MDNKYKYLAKNTALLSISNFSSKLLVFLLVPLYTRFLSTEDYGKYDLIQTTISLLYPILTVNIAEGVMRFLMDRQVEKDSTISVGLKYSLLGCLFFFCIVVVNRIFGIWKILADLSVFAFFHFTVSVFHQYMVQTAKGLEHVRTIAVSGIIGTATTIACNLFFLYYLDLKLPGFFLAYILGEAVPAVYILFRSHIWNYFKRDVDRDTSKTIRKYSAPLILNTLGWWINNVSDRYAVTLMCGVAVNGVYSISYKIPTILSTVQQIFIQAWQISAIREFSSKDSKRFYGNALYYINCLMCLVCMLLIIASKLIAGFLYANDFYAAWQYVPFLLLSVVINAASGILGPVLTAKKNSRMLGLSSLIGAVVNIILNIILIYIMGAQGATVATAVSSFVIFESRRRATIHDVEYRDFLKMILWWGLIAVQAFAMIRYNHYWLQAAIILLSVIINWKTILDISKKSFRFISDVVLKK